MSDWRDEENKAVTQYMLDHYVADGVCLCSLCGNTGIIDTTHTAISPAGVHAGRKNWCICPNGQAMRIQTGKAKPEGAYLSNEKEETQTRRR